MELWGWIIAYVVGFAILQLVVYRYLRNGEDTDLLQTTPPNRESARPDETGERGNDATRRCSNCGARNDPDGPFTYCRRCARRLGP